MENSEFPDNEAATRRIANLKSSQGRIPISTLRSRSHVASCTQPSLPSWARSW